MIPLLYHQVINSGYNALETVLSPLKPYSDGRYVSNFKNVSGVMEWGLKVLRPLTPRVCNLSDGECCIVYFPEVTCQLICHIADCQDVLIGKQEVIRRIGGRKEWRMDGQMIE